MKNRRVLTCLLVLTYALIGALFFCSPSVYAEGTDEEATIFHQLLMNGWQIERGEKSPEGEILNRKLVLGQLFKIKSFFGRFEFEMISFEFFQNSL